ncbi:hypothetical protein JCM2811A_23350 [Methylorubrum rhodinum]
MTHTIGLSARRGSVTTIGVGLASKAAAKTSTVKPGGNTVASVEKPVILTPTQAHRPTRGTRPQGTGTPPGTVDPRLRRARAVPVPRRSSRFRQSRLTPRRGREFQSREDTARGAGHRAVAGGPEAAAISAQ